MVTFSWFLLLVTMLFITIETYRRGGKNIFEPIYYVMLGYFALFVVQFLKMKNKMIDFLGTEVIAFGILLALLGLLAYFLGYRSRIAKKIAISLPIPNQPKPGFLIPIGWFYLLLGLSGYYYFIQFSGGISVFFSAARGAGNYENMSAYIYNATWLLVPGIAILGLEMYRKKMSFLYRYSVVIFIALYFLFQVYIGQRSGILSVGLLILALIYLPNNGFKKLPVRNLLTVALVLLLLIGFVRNFRGEVYYGSDLTSVQEFAKKDIVEQTTQLLSSLGGEADDISWRETEIVMYFRYLEAIPSKVDYDYGYYFLNYFVWWIPRTIWPDRPDLRQEKKVEMERAIGTSHLSGPSVTMLGFNYMHFGAISILVLMYLYGVLFGVLEKVRKFNPENEFVLITYIIFFQSGVMDMLGSGFFQSFHTWAPFKLLPLILVLIMIKLFSRKKYV